MFRRWNSNTWVLSTLLLIILLAGVDVGRRFVKPGGAEPPPIEPTGNPTFQVGDLAPDFTLPDKGDKVRRFSEMVKGDTLLCFTCGCANCRQIQTYMTPLLARMGKKAPRVISVSTQERAGEAAYLRQTGLKQTLLYEPQGGPTMKEYVGHPCPRIYRVDGKRRITWIGPWMNELGGIEGPEKVEMMADQLVRELGFAPHGMPVAHRLEAPDYQAVVHGAPPAEPPPPPDTAANRKREELTLPPYLATPKVGGT